MPDKEKPYTVDGKRVSLEEYRKTRYEDLRVRVLKGKKEILQAHAASGKESLNAFVNRAIAETLERDRLKNIDGACPLTDDAPAAVNRTVE